MSLDRREASRLSLRLLLAIVATLLIGGLFVLIMLLVIGRWGPLIDLDVEIATWANRFAGAHPQLTQAMVLVGAVLHPWVLRILASAVALACLSRGRRRTALWGLTATWGSGLLDIVLKDGVARARPHLPGAAAFAPGFSFPSGHALGSVVCLGVIAASLPAGSPWTRRVVRLPVLLLVALIGFSRVELGVHYPSDVLAAWVLGAGWLAATAAAFDLWRA